MKLGLSCFLLSLLAAVSMTAQTTDILLPDSTMETNIRRKASGEFLLGVMNGAYMYDATFKGEPIPNGDLTVSRLAFSLGIGGHIPLATLGPLTTLWLVPAAIVSANIGKASGSAESMPSGFLDLSVPIHVTVGYGALRRRSAAFGADAGLGINVGRRFAHDAFTVSPSAMVDLSYSPKSVFHLRFMVDVLPGSMGDNKSYRTWSIMLCGSAAD